MYQSRTFYKRVFSSKGMPFVKIPIHNRNIEARKLSLRDWNIPEATKKDLLRFLEELSLGKVNNGKKISEARQLKYLDILKTPLEQINKPIEKITLKDIEKFEKDLTSNKILSHKKKPFESSTKSDLRRMLKIFFKWKLGDTEKYRTLIGWLDTREQKRTPEYLSEQEIIKLFKACKTARERFLIAVLFDSGCRAEEFHNIRYEDVQLPKTDENFCKINLKEEYSKTKGRFITLFWVYSLDAVRDYIREREQDGIKSNEAVYKDTYDSARLFLYRLGKRVLDKNIHFHLFRHSSATYYASKINRQQLCLRYGWTFSSDMPDVYISRAGMDSKELEEKFSGTKIEELKAQLDKSKIKQEEKEQEYLLMFENLKKKLQEIENKT